LAPSGAGLLKVKAFWRQKARVVLRLKISGMINGARKYKASALQLGQCYKTFHIGNLQMIANYGLKNIGPRPGLH